MPDNDNLVALSGSPIHVHKEKVRPFQAAVGSEDSQRIEEHIERHIGPIDMVWHELISDLIHLDVYHIKPTPERQVHILVTSGMSDLPMSPPEEAADSKYAELLITLPAAWPVGEESFNDERHYWPVRMLKWLARFPHEYETWLWLGHTVPNGNPPGPYHASAGFVGAVILPPITSPQEFFSLKCSPDKEVNFFSVVPLYQEEIDLKLRKGLDALFDQFDKYGVDDVINTERRNVARKWWK